MGSIKRKYIWFVILLGISLLLAGCFSYASAGDAVDEYLSLVFGSSSETGYSEEQPEVPGFKRTYYGYSYTGTDAVVTIPAQITTVNSYMFNGSTAVQAVLVPSAVTSVQMSAFSNCPNLRYIIFGTTPDIHMSCIRNCMKLVNISAPAGSAAYAFAAAQHFPVTTKTVPCFARKKVWLLPGDSFSNPLYNCLKVQYSSSKKSVVTVTAGGKVKARKKGKAVITAVTEAGKLSFTVIVGEKTESERVRQVKKTVKSDKEDKTVISKIKAVHDWMIRNIKYDYPGFMRHRIPAVSHTSKGALLKKICVCDGYAYAFKKFMDSYKIPCRVVTGWAGGGGHAWNMVKVGGKWYHVDVTWDDPIYNDGSSVDYSNTLPHYTYFLKSTAYMKKDHAFRTSRFPKCSSKKYDTKGLSSQYVFNGNEMIYVWE